MAPPSAATGASTRPKGGFSEAMAPAASPAPLAAPEPLPPVGDLRSEVGTMPDAATPSVPISARTSSLSVGTRWDFVAHPHGPRRVPIRSPTIAAFRLVRPMCASLSKSRSVLSPRLYGAHRHKTVTPRSPGGPYGSAARRSDPFAGQPRRAVTGL